jgi:hypothetical protein
MDEIYSFCIRRKFTKIKLLLFIWKTENPHTVRSRKPGGEMSAGFYEEGNEN